MENNSMPSFGTSLAFFIVSCIMGFIPFGLIALFPFINLRKAINSGDVATAQACAKKIKLVAMIAIGIFVAIIVLYFLFVIVLAGLFSGAF